MKTWNDYKEHVKTVDPVIAKDMEETEEIAAIVTGIATLHTVEKYPAPSILALSSRSLGIPIKAERSSRIEPGIPPAR